MTNITTGPSRSLRKRRANISFYMTTASSISKISQIRSLKSNGSPTARRKEGATERNRRRHQLTAGVGSVRTATRRQRARAAQPATQESGLALSKIRTRKRKRIRTRKRKLRLNSIRGSSLAPTDKKRSQMRRKTKAKRTTMTPTTVTAATRMMKMTTTKAKRATTTTMMMSQQPQQVPPSLVQPPQAHHPLVEQVPHLPRTNGCAVWRAARSRAQTTSQAR